MLPPDLGVQIIPMGVYGPPYQQGRLHPVQPLGNLGWKGLGYQATQHFQ
jgi:hypothetical protein